VIDTVVITARNLRRLVRVPTLLVFATIQPVLFVLLWTYTFGGAIHPPGVDHYIDYLLPGLFVLSIAFGASQTGVAIADDLATGMIDRFRALPMTRPAVLAGRTLADAVRNLFVVTLMTGLGYAIGFRFHAGTGAALGVIGLALYVGFAFSWLNALIGLLVRDAESAGLAGLIPVVVLVFTSSTFVPIDTMPGWLHAFARINPVTVTVDALRALTLGGPTGHHVWTALAYLTGLLAITIPTAVVRYQHTTR
jgi:ABC-2 type transport system permease protein/oleandomycin transport system permease protein